jgi:branched-subunit amino acid transport protein AzlD
MCSIDRLQDAPCTQNGTVVGSLNRVPFGAVVSQRTTLQERAKLSKVLPCSMIGIVIYCAESENKVEFGQKNKRNIWILVN